MSNGSAPVGQITTSPRSHKFIGDCSGVTIVVSEAWSNHDVNTVAISIFNGERQDANYLLTEDEARQVAALLLKAAGHQDLAEAIPEAVAQIEAKERIRDDAFTALREAERAAEQEFVNETEPQQVAYGLSIAKAELAFTAATGQTISVGRSVHLPGGDPAAMPF